MSHPAVITQRTAALGQEIVRRKRTSAHMTVAATVACTALVLLLTEWQQMNLTDRARLMLGATLMVSAAFAYVLTRAGHHRLGHAIMLAAMWASVTVFAFVSGIGLHSSTMFVFVPVSVFAALMLGPAAGIGFAALCIASLTALYAGHQAGRLGGLQSFYETTTLFNFYLGVVAVCAGSVAVAIAFKRGVRGVFHLASRELGTSERLLGAARASHDRLEEAHLQTAIRKAEMEEAMEVRTRELKMTVSELEEISYALSHDLRAPLRTLSGYATIVASDHAPQLQAEGARMLLLIPATVSRMDRQLGALLEMMRPEQRRLDVRDTNLSMLAAEAAAAFAQPGGRPIVRFDIRPGLRAHCDPARLREVLSELIGNALRFTAGASNPRVEFGSTASGRGNAFFVRDNGAGFDSRFAAQLFRPFVTVHPDSTWAGLGIGLAKARQVVRRHGGEIWADASLGGGATFYFTLAPASWYPAQESVPGALARASE